MRMEATERATRLSLARDLLGEIDSERQGRVAPKTALERLRKGALDSLSKELKGLVAILGAGNAKLVFIGQVGVGKTTAICHLVGLTAEREKRKKNRAGVEKVVQVTEDLMATGGGFTTLCEVVVVPGDDTEFRVEPFERSEVERTIDDFCVSIWGRLAPSSDDAADSGPERQVNFPPELVRAVRNMVRLPEGERREDDAALRLAQGHPRSDFEGFRASVQARANLDARTVTEFRCPAPPPH